MKIHEIKRTVYVGDNPYKYDNSIKKKENSKDSSFDSMLNTEIDILKSKQVKQENNFKNKISNKI